MVWTERERVVQRIDDWFWVVNPALHEKLGVDSIERHRPEFSPFEVDKSSHLVETAPIRDSAEVASESDADSTAVFIVEGGQVAVDVASTNSPVSEGDSLEVTATIENTGGASTTESVSLSIGDETVDTVETTLEGGEAETVTLTWQTAVGDAGAYEVVVESQSNSDSSLVTLTEAEEDDSLPVPLWALALIILLLLLLLIIIYYERERNDDDD